MAKFNHVPLMTFDQAQKVENLSEYYFMPQLEANLKLATADTGENYFFSRELEHIIPEMLMFEYGRISARNVFPIDRRAGPGAEIITLRQMTKVGAAKIVTDYANDIPLANVFTDESSSNIRSIAEAAEWSVQEIRAASLANRPLDRDKTEAAREDMLRLESKIAWQGDAANGIAGFFTDTNIPRFTVPDGASTDPEWSTKTGAEMVADANAVVNPIAENTNGVEAANTLIIPRAQYNLFHTTRMETGTDTTALQFFVNNSPYIASMANVVPVDDIAGLGTAGVDVMIAMDRNASKLVMNIPLDIEQFAPQIRDMTTRVIYHMRVGGVLIKKPLSIRIAQAI